MLKQPFSNLPSSTIALDPKSLFHQLATLEKHVLVSEESDEYSEDSLEDMVFGEDINEKAATKSHCRNSLTPIASGTSTKEHWYDTTIAPQTIQKCFVPLKHLPPSFHQNGKEDSFHGVRKNLFPVYHIDEKERLLAPPKESRATESAPDSAASQSSSLPVAVAVATPVLPINLQESCCKNCSRKDEEIRRQAKEIAQLQTLVTQMVATLGKTLTADVAKAESPLLTSSISPTSATCSFSDISCDSSLAGNDGDCDMPGFEPEKLVSLFPSHVALSALESESSQTDSCFLRLSRAQAERQQTAVPGGHQTSSKRLRHVPVVVAGIPGFYSGPPIEACLHGCVIRLENGDQYLGELRRVDTESECIMEFHGMGTLYRKDGSIVRGRFWHNQAVRDSVFLRA